MKNNVKHFNLQRVLLGVCAVLCAFIMVIISKPKFVKAETNVGTAYIKYNGTDMIVPININNFDWPNYEVNRIVISGGFYYGYDNTHSEYNGVRLDLRINVNNQNISLAPNYNLWGHQYTLYSAYIPTLSIVNIVSNITFYTDETEFNNTLPDSLKPSITKQRWDAFYEWYKSIYGFYPMEGSLIDTIRKLALGDETEETEITYPTLTPTPSPTPTPTPIPVQTIFVPDGNGSTTIVYQYTNPDTGIVTQSPYNPNIENNIEVNCDCYNTSSDNTFTTDPLNPVALNSSMLWADGFGVEMSENPLTVANNSQQSLADAAAEYTESVNVVSNSFNILPFKWLTLVGLCGGILIIAGLIRTFLGG